MRRRRWHQFTTMQLLALATALAAVWGALALLSLPEFLMIPLMAFFFLEVAWLVLRRPRVTEALRDLRRRKRRLAAHRRALEAEVQRLREQSRDTKRAAATVPNAPHAQSGHCEPPAAPAE